MQARAREQAKALRAGSKLMPQGVKNPQGSKRSLRTPGTREPGLNPENLSSDCSGIERFAARDEQGAAALFASFQTPRNMGAGVTHHDPEPT